MDIFGKLQIKIDDIYYYYYYYLILTKFKETLLSELDKLRLCNFATYCNYVVSFQYIPLVTSTNKSLALYFFIN
jgi:hypothetical protein